MSVAAASLFFALLAVAADLLVVGTLGLVAVRATAGRSAPAGVQRSLASLHDGGLWLAWLAALIATLGSLYYSEVVGFEPCRLCWYQRIAMYPLAVILGIAAVTGDRRVRRYVLPLAVIGGAISTYHYLLQWFPTLETGACSTDVPCTAFYVRQLGFVSIPFMALSAFALIITGLLVRAEGLRGGADAPDSPPGGAGAPDRPDTNSEGSRP